MSWLFLSVHFWLLLIFIQVISQLKVLGRSAAAGCKFDREIWSNELSPVLNLWKKLNQVSAGVVLQLLPRFPPYPFFFFFFPVLPPDCLLVKLCTSPSCVLVSGKEEDRQAWEAGWLASLSCPLLYQLVCTCCVFLWSLLAVSLLVLWSQRLLVKVAFFTGLRVLREHRWSAGSWCGFVL